MFLKLSILLISLCCISALPQPTARVETNKHGITHYYWKGEYVGCSYIFRNKTLYLNNRGYEAGEVSRFRIQMVKDSYEGKNKFKQNKLIKHDAPKK